MPTRNAKWRKASEKFGRKQRRISAKARKAEEPKAPSPAPRTVEVSVPPWCSLQGSAHREGFRPQHRHRSDVCGERTTGCPPLHVVSLLVDGGRHVLMTVRPGFERHPSGGAVRAICHFRTQHTHAPSPYGKNGPREIPQLALLHHSCYIHSTTHISVRNRKEHCSCPPVVRSCCVRARGLETS